MAKIDWSEFSPVDSQSGDAVDWNTFTPIPAEKDQPGLLARAKQGLQSTVGNIKIAATNDPAAIAQTIAEGEKTRLPQTATQIKMAQEMKPLQQEYQDAEGLDAVGVFARMAAKRLAQFITNPSEAASAVVENLPNSAPGLAAGAAGAAAGTAALPGVGTVVGGVVGGTAGGYAVEQGAAMRDQILKEATEQGIDPRDPRALEPLIRDKYDQFLEKSRLKGIGTAGTDAVLNAVTFGLAGAGERAIVRGVAETGQAARAGAITAEQAAARLGELQAQQAARTTLGARAARGAAVTGAEMGGEGLSEAAGQKLAYGQVDPLEVIDESILGLGQGVGMAASRGLVNRAIGQPNAGTVEKAFAAAQEELSRRRQAEAQAQLQQAPDAATAAAAANALAGSVDELTSAVDDYLRGAPQPPAELATAAAPAAAEIAPAPVDTSVPALRARADREAELLAQANQAGTDFERRMALEQLQATRPEAPARTAGQFADLTPMDQRQANLRLTALRDEVANQGGNALALSVVPHPSQAGKFAIGRVALPSLELEAAPAPTTTPANAQSRLESAALAGQIEQRRAEDAPRQQMISRAMANIEARGGVASPYEAELLRSANMGQPFDRIDPSIGRPASTDEKLTAASGVPVGQEAKVGFGARETGSETQRLAALEQRNTESMSEQEARNAANRAQAERATQAMVEETSRPAAAPSANDVIEAFKTPGAQRSAEQVSTIRQAQSRYSASDFGILERAARGTFQLNTPERMRLATLTSPAAPAAETAAAAPADTGLTGTRVLERLGQPTGGRIITTGAKFSTQRNVAPGATVSIKDGETEHSVTVVDASKLGATGRLLTQVARIFGKRLVAFQSDTLQADGFVMDNDNRSIFVNTKTQISPLAVFGHELTHLLKRDNPQAYAALQTVVERELGEGALQQFEQEYGAGANLEELTSDLVGDRFQDADFWTAVFDEVAAQNPEGARGIITRLAAAITKAVNAFLKLVRQPGFNAARFVKDANAVKTAVTQALAQYAQSQREAAVQLDQEAAPTEAMASTEPAEATLSPARRGGVAEEAGEFKIRTQKDGTLGVAGDVAKIRSLLPEDVRGRQVPGGMVFTNADAPRVRAALEGRKLAYSRGGQVVDKLPMKDGKYLGAPEKFNTPAKIPTLRKLLRQLTLEGERGRYWYENSSREVLQMVGGNVQEARKFVALLAIYSPQAKVDANSTFALRAWAQYKAGQPISVKTGVMDAKAQAAMDNVDAFWSGEKTGNFFFNLLREIDPSTAGKQGATIDMWMMRAGQYDNDAPTATQYAFMENETNRLAQELGWEPQQVQAAIWVAMKARMENAGVKKRTEASSEKKKWIRYDYPIKKGRPVKTRVILNAQAHRDNWLKHAFEHTPTKEDTAQAKFDFSDGVRRHIGQLSWEARPGRSTNVLPGVNDAPYEQQVEFQQAVQKALLDDNGVDLLAYKVGLLVDGPDILAPGVWQGEIAAGMQKLIALAPAKGEAGKTSIDPAQKQAIETYAAMMGLLLRQEGVGYHRPFYASTMSAANGVNLDIGRTLTPDEAQALWGAIDQRMREAGVDNWENGAGMISSPTGIRVVNFGALDDNGKFRALVKEAAGTLPVDEVELVAFASDGDLVFNDWKESPNGEGYRSRIGAAGSPDLLDWARDVLAPRVQSVFNEFSSRYGWGDPGQVEALFDQAQEQEVEQSQPADQQAVPEGAQGAQLSRTRQAPDTPEFRRWFGDSKVVDANGEPLVMYHGTTANIDAFVAKNGAIFLSPDPKFASRIALNDMLWDEMSTSPAPQNAQLLSVYVKSSKPFDYESAKDISVVAQLLDPRDRKRFKDGAAEGRWQDIEDFLDSVKEAGFDSAYIKEQGRKNLAVFEPTQIKSATGNNGNFDAGNPDITQSPRRNLGPLTQAQEQALTNVGGVVVQQTHGERMRELADKFSGSWLGGIFDQFAELSKLDMRAYILARLSKGSEGTLEATMLYGKPVLRNDVLDVDVNDEGFAKVLGRLEGEQDRFLWWIAAQRAERLKAQGLENLFTDQDITSLKTLNQGNLPGGAARGQSYSRALQEMNDFNDAVLKVAEDSGLIDPEARKLFKDLPHVPFYRVMDEEGGVAGPTFSSGLTSQSAWKKLKGGKQKLNNDLLANVLMNWSHLYAASAKNRAANAALEAGEAAGIARKVPAGTKGAVRTRVGGKEVFWEVDDAGVLAAISAIEYKTPGFFKPFSTMKRWLSIGVTANPAYKVKNLVRDSVAAPAVSELSGNIVGNVARGLKGTAADSQSFASMIAGGGVIRFGAMLDGKNADRTRTLVRREGGVLLDEAGWKKLSQQMGDLWDAYNEVGDRFENANRVALYDQLLAKGYSQLEANFMARDLMDFSMQGRWALVRFLAETVPFLNTRLQGLLKLGKGAKENPRKFGAVVGAVALASIALMLAYDDDKDWKKREDWDRDTNWWFKIGGVAYLIPKPFEVGALGTLAERGWELAFNKEMTMRRFGQTLSRMIFSTFAMDPTPQIIKPIADIYANKSGFTNRPVEGLAMQRLRPEDRYDENTSYAARFLGQLGLPNPAGLARGEYAKLSPVQVDYLLRGYFGWLGTAATTVLDFGLRPAFDQGERPERQLRETFFVGNFAETLPSNSSRYLTQLYEQSKEIEQAYNSHRDALKRGDREGARAIMKDEREKLRAYDRVKDVRQDLAELSARIRQVEASKTLSGETKRKMIDQLKARQDRMAERAAARLPQ